MPRVAVAVGLASVFLLQVRRIGQDQTGQIQADLDRDVGRPGQVQRDFVRDPAPQFAVQGEVEGGDDSDTALRAGAAEEGDVHGVHGTHRPHYEKQVSNGP